MEPLYGSGQSCNRRQQFGNSRQHVTRMVRKGGMKHLKAWGKPAHCACTQTEAGEVNKSREHA
eukprot:scaffold67899_cov19-Tisochrysis_lutea.AAC.1